MKKQSDSLNLPTKQQLNIQLAKVLRKDFFLFLKYYWDVIIPEDPIWNWHIPYLCKELQTMAERVIKREKSEYDLIVNIPPGSTKSTIATVMFPLWCWINDPSMRFITGSYSQSLSIDHAQLSRDILRSEKFMSVFPELILRDDKDQKQNYGNAFGGERMTTSVGGSSTGKHAHMIIIDDPINPKEAMSDTERDNANRWLDLTLSTRKVDKSVTPTILIMQRLHEDDCTGHMLAKKGKSVKHICLPATKEINIRPIELGVKYVDNMLDPIRLSHEVLDGLKLDMGSYGYAGQMLQSPAPLEGGLIKGDWFTYVDRDKLPYELVPSYYSDTAYGKEQSDNSATMCYSVRDGVLYVLDMWVVNLGLPEFKEGMVKFLIATNYSARGIIRLEPKATGISVVQEMKTMKDSNGSLYNVVEAKTPKDSKITRVQSILPFIEAGKVCLVKAPWNDAFVSECKQFPNGVHDDQVDTLSAVIDIEINNSFEVNIGFV